MKSFCLVIVLCVSCIPLTGCRSKRPPAKAESTFEKAERLVRKENELTNKLIDRLKSGVSYKDVRNEEQELLEVFQERAELNLSDDQINRLREKYAEKLNDASWRLRLEIGKSRRRK